MSSALGSVAITSSILLSVSGPNQTYGMGSGTTEWNPIMIESGGAGLPQRVVTAGAVTVDAAFIPSGNIFIVSGLMGRASGTVIDKFLMVESGNDPIQRLVTAGTVSVDSVFVASGNLFLQSGDNLLGSFAITSQVPWNAPGSIYGTGIGSVHADVLGSVVVSSALGSVAITSATALDLQGGSILAFGKSGTQINPILIGSAAAGTPQPLIMNQGTSPWITENLGSVAITSSVALSVNSTQVTDPWIVLGSTQSIQGTDPWIVEGSVRVVTQTIGSIYGTAIGSLHADVLGSVAISSQANWDGVGSAFITDGSVTASINALPIGSIFGIGVGSVHSTTHYADLGSPSFKVATTNASGDFIEVFDPGAGSFLEIHGYGFSTRRATTINFVGSATTPIIIRTHYIDVPSGVEFEKTFAMPIRPIGSTVPLGFNTSVLNGSVSFTIYGRPVAA